MDYVSRALEAVADWRAAAGPMPSHPALTPDPARFEAAWAEFGERMAGSYPFHHPRYAGQMIKPPHPVAVAPYLAAMHRQPQQPRARRRRRRRRRWSRRSMRELAAMFGLAGSPPSATSPRSGTIANLEALWIAREVAPGHGRRTRRRRALHPRAHVPGARRGVARGARRCRRARRPRRGRGRGRPTAGSGRWCVTPGTTGLGAVDDIRAALELKERHGVRLHVDKRLRRLLHPARRARPGRIRPRHRRMCDSRGRRSAQARPAALRLRRGAVRRPRASGASTSTTRRIRTSPRTSCTSARSPWSARARGPPRGRCG